MPRRRTAGSLTPQNLWVAPTGTRALDGHLVRPAMDRLAPCRLVAADDGDGGPSAAHGREPLIAGHENGILACCQLEHVRVGGAGVVLLGHRPGRTAAALELGGERPRQPVVEQQEPHRGTSAHQRTASSTWSTVSPYSS